MNDTTGTDIQEYNFMVNKAYQNDISVIVSGNSFVLKRVGDSCMLGKFFTVGECFNYVCGYEAGLDKGLVDGSDISGEPV